MSALSGDADEWCPARQASRVEVDLEQAADGVVLRVRDNGRHRLAQRVGTKSLGLLGMRERVHSAGRPTQIRGAPARTEVLVKYPWPRALTTIKVRFDGRADCRPSTYAKSLIADDLPLCAKGSKRSCAKPPNPQVGEANNGAEALAQVEAEAWDVVVLDITMPGRTA